MSLHLEREMKRTEKMVAMTITERFCLPKYESQGRQDPLTKLLTLQFLVLDNVLGRYKFRLCITVQVGSCESLA